MSQAIPPNPYASPSDLPPHGADPGKPLPESPMGAPTKDECTMAMLAHLLGALLSFIGPLIIWLMKKDESAFVNDQGKEALNFQLTLLIAHVMCFAAAVFSCGFLSFLPMVPAVCGLVFGILGCVEANKGVAYRYPLNIRMIS